MIKKTINSLALMSLLSGSLLTACGGDDQATTDENPDGFDSASDIVEPDKPEGFDENNTTSESAGLNGTYSAQGVYESPGGTDTISVSLTLEDGTITAVDVEPVGNLDETSLQYIGQFSAGVDDQVVGVDLSELGDLTFVNGSSLTPSGFNEAVKEIKASVL